MGVKGPAARRAMQALLVIAVVVGLGYLATGCSSSGGVKEAISSFTAGKSIKPTRPQVTASAVVPPATAAPSPQPSAAASAQPPAHRASSGAVAAAGSGSSSVLLWTLVGIGAALIIGLVAWIAHRSGRRSARTATWQARAADAYAQGEALQDAISVAETPGALAAEDAVARWADIQRRADDFAQTLYALRESAPNEDARTVVSNVLVSLQGVRSAMSAERASGADGGYGAATVRARMSFLEMSLRELREPAARPV